MEAARQCAKERKEWRDLVHMYMIEFQEAILLGSFFGPPSRALGLITWRGAGFHYMMRFGKTVKMVQRCMLGICMSVI